MADRASGGEMKDSDVEWVVNDISELGVKIGNEFFWLYKGQSLVYEDATHDDGTPMMWRYVYKREFGECCHPWYTIKQQTGSERLPENFIKAYGDIDDWMPLPKKQAAEVGE